MKIIKNINYKGIIFWKKLLIFLTLITAIYGLYITKNHFLDDTFIHLKIAKNIIENGIYSFNGSEKDFSTSSVLYTSILSIGLRIWDSPYLVKIINVVVYFLIYSLTTIFLLNTKNLKSLILSLFLIGMSSPLGVRWLTDGMESSLVILFSIIISYILYSVTEFQALEYKKIYYFLTFFFCFLSILLRIEFAFIIVWFIFVSMISRLFLKEKLGFNIYASRIYPLVLSLLTSFSFLYINFRSFTPDTSIAKAGKNYDLNFFIIVLKAHLSASLFGVALILSSLISLYLINTRPNKLNQNNQKYFANLINFSLPIMIILILIKGQIIHGVRYFLFLETFLISFNLLICNRYDCKQLIKFKKNYQYFFIPLIISTWIIHDFNVLNRISKGRSETFLNMSNQDLSCLHNRKLLAWDVGMIGYFSKAYILDSNGLVNGREFAKLSKDQRLKQFINNEKIDYVFANNYQIDEIEKYIDLKKWINLGSYEFPNFNRNSKDIHYLLKSPDSESC